MGTPNKPCSECPFRIENAQKWDPIFVDQMAANAGYLNGFPCHKANPSNDILTCPSAEQNANDCIGYRLMLENAKVDETIHPEIVGCFDELIKGPAGG